jgi:ABC-type Fe3+ transport system substrate-binding protein
MAPITDYLILPEVKDLNNWNAPEFIYPDDGHHIFVHTYQREQSLYQNLSFKGSKLITKPEDLLNPVFKGQIATREPSALNAGTLALSGLLRENGLPFLQRLFNEQEPVIIDNPRQLIDSVIRGDKMVVIGGSSDIYSQCALAGACDDVKPLPMGMYVTSRGVTVLKNAPHKDATKVWINWLLSKKGQETWVRVWAEHNSAAGAISLRKDVAPDPKHVGSIPNYETLGKYTLTADESGRDYTEQVVETYKAYKTRPR